MPLLDLNEFSDQLQRLEQANRKIDLQAKELAPNHLSHQRPTHVLYGGAHLFTGDDPFKKIATLAQHNFAQSIPDVATLKHLVNQPWSDDFATRLYERVAQKILTEPLEDYRIDFEDGYGVRSEEDEDHHAVASATCFGTLLKRGKRLRSVGLRIKPLSAAGMRRGLKTLSLFIEQLTQTLGAERPIKSLVVTLPKVTNSEQVATLITILEAFETRFGYERGFFAVELLIESPEALISRDGRIPLPDFLAAANGRCQSLHFGVYDFTASLGIGSAGQAIDHLACDFARLWMQIVASIAPGVGLSDGIINRLPLLPKVGRPVDDPNYVETWRYNFHQMTRSLNLGFYQGWDLHPCQLPIRHIATYSFVLSELDSAVTRLKTFLNRSAQASHVKGLFDDRASVLGLIHFFERGVASGVLTKEELGVRGVDLEAVREFLNIG